MARHLPIVEMRSSIRDDGSRATVHPADVTGRFDKARIALLRARLLKADPRDLLRGDDIPTALAAHLETLRAGLKLGNGALASRSDALADLGRHMARVEAWHESAEGSLHSLHGKLERIADARDLPESWADAFFNA